MAVLRGNSDSLRLAVAHVRENRSELKRAHHARKGISRRILTNSLGRLSGPDRLTD